MVAEKTPIRCCDCTRPAHYQFLRLEDAGVERRCGPHTFALMSSGLPSRYASATVIRNRYEEDPAVPEASRAKSIERPDEWGLHAAANASPRELLAAAHSAIHSGEPCGSMHAAIVAALAKWEASK